MYSLLMESMECPENPCDEVVGFENAPETIDEYFFLIRKCTKAKLKEFKK